MKKFLFLLIAVLMFFGCAIIGFQMASGAVDLPGGAPTPAPVKKTGDEYRLIVLYVDDLNAQPPTLLSTWYVSLFFMEDGAPTVTFAQIQPNPQNLALADSIQKAFSLDAQGIPNAGFWKSFNPLGLNWDSYLVIDQASVQRFLEWVNGPGNYAAVMDALNERPLEVQQLLISSCKKSAGIDNQPKESFVWDGIVPAHFRSNLRMEQAISSWSRLAKAARPVRCEVLLAR
jgi:hypothetical protein